MMTNNEIQYKAYRFRREVDKTTFAYGAKSVRALWDPTLSIPGTGRRGGWRCPVGTRYGGQITDRFGRNCGWGVARRLANAITNIGERLENVDDRRRGRRVSKRNRRMLGRLQRNAEAGRAERGLRGIAERLEGGAEAGTETPTVPRKRRVRNERKPRGQLGRGWRGVLDPNGRRYWERDNRGWFDGSDGEEGDVPEADATPDTTPTRPGAGRVGDTADDGTPAPKRRRRRADADADARDEGLRESERRRVRRELEEPGAPRTDEDVKPEEVKPRRPRKRRVRASEQRAQESASRKPAKEVVPAGTQKKPTKRIDLTEEMVELDLAPGESAPDERSFRNVNNRFPKSGLPDTAYWREQDFPEGEEKAELERRFGRYYGADNNINNRGKVVNQELKRRRGGKDKPKFDLPSEPPKRPPVPEVRENKPTKIPTDTTELVKELEGSNAIGEGLFPADGFVGRDGAKVTQDAYRQKVQWQLKARRREYDMNASENIAKLTPSELRKIRNNADNNVDRWKQGYDAAKALLDNELAKHEGKKLNGIPAEDQQRIVAAIDNVNEHAMEIANLKHVVKKYDDHLAKVEEGAPENPVDPYDGVGPLIESQPPPQRRNITPNRNLNYEGAVKAVHEDGQPIDNIADELIVDAMIDEELKIANNQGLGRANQLNKETLQKEGFGYFLRRGEEMENRRFKFKLVQTKGAGQGVWDVVKVTDKRDGSEWFLKAAVYGHNGAMLEGIGMRAAEALQLGNDKAHLRIGAPIVDAKTGKRHRWMMMRGIKDWDAPKNVDLKGEWKDISMIPWELRGQIAAEDAARIAVLDFVFQNGDRHQGNFMFNVDQDGQARLGLIDHGLIGMGRGLKQPKDHPVDAARDVGPYNKADWDKEVDSRIAKLKRSGVAGYGREFNNGIQGLREAGYAHGGAADPAKRERFARIAERSLRALEKQVDSILDAQQLQAKGMVLTDAEKLHLDALKTLTNARIAYLKTHLDDLVREFNS